MISQTGGSGSFKQYNPYSDNQKLNEEESKHPIQVAEFLNIGSTDFSIISETELEDLQSTEQKSKRPQLPLPGHSHASGTSPIRRQAASSSIKVKTMISNYTMFNDRVLSDISSINDRFDENREEDF